MQTKIDTSLIEAAQQIAPIVAKHSEEAERERRLSRPVLDALRERRALSHHRIVYVGDGSSDVHVMMHVNRLEGLTIAVSENRYITQIARRTVLSDDALSVLVPVLETIAGWSPTRIREFFEAHGFALREWEKVQTDSLTIVLRDAAGNWTPTPQEGSVAVPTAKNDLFRAWIATLVTPS